ACRNSSARVLALYIATPRQWATHNMSPRQAELINAQLNGLQIALAEKGIPLLFREVDDFVASVCVFRSIRSRIGIEVRSAIRIHSINRELNFFYRFLTRFFAAFHYRGIFPQ